MFSLHFVLPIFQMRKRVLNMLVQFRKHLRRLVLVDHTVLRPGSFKQLIVFKAGDHVEVSVKDHLAGGGSQIAQYINSIAARGVFDRLAQTR